VPDLPRHRDLPLAHVDLHQKKKVKMVKIGRENTTPSSNPEKKIMSYAEHTNQHQ
jgi:hypothetical protein